MRFKLIPGGKRGPQWDWFRSLKVLVTIAGSYYRDTMNEANACKECGRAIVTLHHGGWSVNLSGPKAYGGREREYCSDACRKRASRRRAGRRKIA